VFITEQIEPDSPDKGHTPLRALQDHYEVLAVVIGVAEDCLDRLALDYLDLDDVCSLEFSLGEELSASVAVYIGFALGMVPVAQLQATGPQAGAPGWQAHLLVIFSV